MGNYWSTKTKTKSEEYKYEPVSTNEEYKEKFTKENVNGKICVEFSLPDGKHLYMNDVTPEDIERYKRKNRGEFFPLEGYIAHVVRTQILGKPAQVTITRIGVVESEVDKETGHVEIVEWLHEIYPSEKAPEKTAAQALYDFWFPSTKSYIWKPFQNLTITVLENGYIGFNNPNPQFPIDIIGDVNISGQIRRDGVCVK